MFPFKKNAAQPEAQGPLNTKLQTIKAQLGALNAAQGQTKVGGEGATISDDAPLPADKRAAIARDETLVRGALKAVGVDYDALISMEGQEGKTSPYALAAQANPQVLNEVLASDIPVLKALEVAVGFKPYAEFTAKYGSAPEAIKAAIKAEALAESKGQAEAEEPKSAGNLPFSRRQTMGAPKATKAGKGGLTEVFRK